MLLFRLLALSIFLYSASALGQNVFITGTASNYMGQSVSLLQTEDYVSNKRSVLFTCPIAKDGSFQFSTTVLETRQLILAIGQIEGILYAESDKKYTIEFPAFQEGDYKRFDRNEVALNFIQLPENDLNILVRAFNTDYAKFIEDHYFEFAADMYAGSETYQVKQIKSGSTSDMIPPSKTADAPTKEQETIVDAPVIDVQIAEINKLVNAFETEVDTKYSPYYTNTFFKHFVRYSLAELFLISGYDKKKVYENYFMSQKVLHQNPAYMKFFHVFYDQLLINKPKAIQDEIYRTVNAASSSTALTDLFRSDSLLLSEPLREMAVVKGLKDIYYNDQFVRGGVLRTLLSMSENAQTEAAQKSAKWVHNKFTRCKAGWSIEDFTLLDGDNEKWTFSEHLGKHMYIVFFAQWSASCVKELQVLQKWQEQYNKDIEFVAISMDSNYDQFTSFLNKNRSQKCTFLFGGGDPLLREKFELTSVPSAMLLDPDGKVMSDYTRLPSGGVQLDFAKIAAKKGKQSAGTWKEK